MSRRKKYKYNGGKILSFILILFGITVIILCLPLWVWAVILGIICIFGGINIYSK